MTKEELQEWRAHPATKKVFIQLRKYQDIYKDLALSCWESGNIERIVPYYKGRYDLAEEILNMEVSEDEC